MLFGKKQTTELDVPDYLVVGLGNPGSEYIDTRHNAGFKTVDLVASKIDVRYWKNESGALTGRGRWEGLDILVAKPQSFMNASGGPVKALAKKYGIEPEHIIVIHDELDIPSGTVRVKFGGGHAGHNGLKSIGEKLETRDWLRVRVGIGRPPGRMEVVNFVLSVPKGEAAEEFNLAIQLGADAVFSLMKEGLSKTQQQFH